MSGKRYIPAEEAKKRWGHPAARLGLWRRKCPALGRPIRSRRGAEQGNHYLYSEEDLERIAKIPTLTDGRLEDSHGVWLTIQAVESTFKFHDNELWYWRTKDCPALGRKIQAKHLLVHAGRRFCRHWLYLESDLEIVAAARRKPAEPDGEFLTDREGEAEFGMPRDSIHEWGRSGCTALGGRPIRSRRELRKIGTRLMRVRVYAREDLEAIQAFRAAGVSTDGDGLTMTEAAKEVGVNRESIWRWSKSGHAGLGGRCLRYRTEKRHVARRGRIEIRLYDRRDLHAIRDFRATGVRTEIDVPAVAKVARSTEKKGRGRPKQDEREQFVRRRAKADGLIEQPAELTRRLNSDEEFVGRWGKTTKAAVRGILYRWKGRAQKS